MVDRERSALRAAGGAQGEIEISANISANSTRRRHLPALHHLGAISQVWLCSRPEKVIAIVGHGGLFSLILGHHLKNCGHEWRTMQMDERPETELV